MCRATLPEQRVVTRMGLLKQYFAKAAIIPDCLHGVTNFPIQKARL